MAWIVVAFVIVLMAGTPLLLAFLARRKNSRRMMVWLAVAFTAIVLAMGIPLLIDFIVSGLARAHDCILDEGQASPCIVGGSDWGDTLHLLFILRWFVALTMPFEIIALLVWLVVSLILVSNHWR